MGTCILLLAAVVAMLPFVHNGPACGADFIFHFTSWHDVLNSWRQGILYPHWAASANFRAGEPRFVFYPPLTWMLGGALGVVLPWSDVPFALNLLILAAGALATRALAREVLPEGPAVLAGCTAVFSGYSLYEVYHHSDFALLTGGFWIPLLLLLFFRQQKPTSTALFSLGLNGATAGLALALAGTWLSNTPLGLMATYLLAAAGILAAVHARSWSPLLRVGVSLALGLGLAAFYLAPATVEQHWVDIQQLMASPQHLIENRWITSELRNGRERRRGVIEVVMVLMAFAGMAVAWLRRNQDDVRSGTRLCWLVLGAIPFVVCFLLFPVSLPVWNLVPRLRFLQYPWRWLVVLQAPMAILFAAGVASLGRVRVLATVACALLFVFAVYHLGRDRTFFWTCDGSSTGPFSMAAMTRGLQPGAEGVGGFEEYTTPRGAKNDLVATGLPVACVVQNPAAIFSTLPSGPEPAYYTPRAWSSKLGTCTQQVPSSIGSSAAENLHLHFNTATPAFAVLRLRSYPAWHVLVNGRVVSERPQRADGLLVVPVPSGPVELTVNWKNSWEVIVGRSLSTLSALSLFALTGSLWWHTRRSRVVPNSPTSA